MASYDSEAECGVFGDGNWTDKLQDDDVNYASETQPGSDCDDHFSMCVADHSSHHPPYQASGHCVQHSTSLVIPNNDDDDDEDDDDDDDDAGIYCWHEAGRALRTFLSESSETRLLFGNDDMLVTNANIDCRRKPADRSVSAAYARCSTTDDSDLCLNDCQSLPVRHRSSLPANDLLLLDDNSQPSFFPLFRELRHKISHLGNEHQEQFPSTSRQRRERPEGYDESSQLKTWSEISSSDESDDLWFDTSAGRRCRQYSGNRRLKSDERWSDDWWARSCSEEPAFCSAGRSLVSHHSRGRRRRKKPTTEKCLSVLGNKEPNDAPLHLEAGIAKERQTWHQCGTSVSECLADIESNATDSVSNDDDDDEDNGYAFTKRSDAASSSVMAPIACSFHCIPPDRSDRETARLTSSSIDFSRVSSPVCDKDDLHMSSENELSASLGNGYGNISDHESCHSSYSFAGILCRLFIPVIMLDFKVVVKKHFSLRSAVRMLYLTHNTVKVTNFMLSLIEKHHVVVYYKLIVSRDVKRLSNIRLSN